MIDLPDGDVLEVAAQAPEHAPEPAPGESEETAAPEEDAGAEE